MPTHFHIDDAFARTLAVTEVFAEIAAQQHAITGDPRDRQAWLEAEALVEAARLGPSVHDLAWLAEMLREALRLRDVAPNARSIPLER